MKDMRLSAPVWLWFLYGGLIIAMAVLAGPAFFYVLFTAAFSFQFWTFAAWKGAKDE